MTATVAASHFLDSLPEPIATELVDTIRAAAARNPISGPGIRSLLPGLAWRLEAHGCRLAFGLVDGQPVIVTASLTARPRPRRRPRTPRRTETRS